MYKIVQSSRFERELKKIKKRGKSIDKLKSVVAVLATGKKLPFKNRNHKLIGEWEGYFDCHIEPDWILIYGVDNTKKEIILFATGSHSDLF